LLNNQIDIIEKDIDHAWDTLSLYRLPLHTALFMALSCFSDYIGLVGSKPTHSSFANARQNLQLLIPKIFSVCQRAYVREKDLRDLRKIQTSYLYAIDAFGFTSRYQPFTYYISGYKQGWFDCIVKDRKVRFTPVSDAANILVHHALTKYHEQHYVDHEAIKQISIDSPSEKVLERLTLAIKHRSYEEVLSFIPTDVIAVLRDIVLASSPAPTVDSKIEFNGYTIGEYYQFWITLSALMFAYLEACRIKYNRQPETLINSRVLQLKPAVVSEVVAQVSKQISPESAQRIVSGLILDLNIKRPDIQIQPLVPTYINDVVFLAPGLIYTSNWEVCLLRHWARLSPEKYGEVVASKKSRLADELAGLFHQPNYRTAIRKTFRDIQRNTKGDVDLAILEESSGSLMFIEIKWLIEPDSFQEESHALEEIDKGIEQLGAIENQFTLNRDQFLEGIFDRTIRGTNITSVLYLIISRGSVESRKNTKYDILDYDLSYDLLKNSPSLPLRSRIQEIMEAHQRLLTKTKAELRYGSFKIAGYLIQFPIISRARIGQEPLIGKKSKCPCGSGRPYKECCQIILDYSENDVSFDSDL
jgi:hypothetical protein